MKPVRSSYTRTPLSSEFKHNALSLHSITYVYDLTRRIEIMCKFGRSPHLKFMAGIVIFSARWPIVYGTNELKKPGERHIDSFYPPIAIITS